MLHNLARSQVIIATCNLTIAKSLQQGVRALYQQLRPAGIMVSREGEQDGGGGGGFMNRGGTEIVNTQDGVCLNTGCSLETQGVGCLCLAPSPPIPSL